MSPLTKLFVVLLVILSLLMTAGTVVYVTRENKELANLDIERGLRAAAETARDQNAAALQAAQQNLTALQQQVNSQAASSAQALNAAQQQIADLNVQLAKANSNAATQELQIARLTEGLQAAQNTMSAQNQTIAQLRQSGDQLVRQAAESSSRISDLTNRLEITEAERRNLAEQLQEALTHGGQNTASGAQAAGATVAAPPIQGVIRNTQEIADKPYATISVGSADNVAKGMQFKVIDRNAGTFLGTLTVDAVEPNESSGILSGPHIDQIKPGTEVRTQY